MRRLFVVTGLLVGWGGFVGAKPPVEQLVQGKERTPVERDLHQPETPPAVESLPKLPESRNPIRVEMLPFGEFGDTVLRLTRMPLGVVPLSPLVWW